MLEGVFCASPKPWFLNSHSLACGSAAHHRQIGSPIKLLDECQRRHHSAACSLNCGGGGGGGGAASIWHAILPVRAGICKLAFHQEHKGEGSWNVAWDARPARWLYRPDSVWLLFGVCACLAAPLEILDLSNEQVAIDEPIDEVDDKLTETITSDVNFKNSANYTVKGVPADGRCLFRAIAHMACLKNGVEAPDENRQRELADELRAQVVDELSLRRKEVEWFIEGDFDDYVKRIQQPFVWGGEPELLMSSHVLKTMISVYMLDRRTDNLKNIANYGEEYQKDDNDPIKVLFHGYGHYDILESVSKQTEA